MHCYQRVRQSGATVGSKSRKYGSGSVKVWKTRHKYIRGYAVFCRVYSVYSCLEQQRMAQ